MARAAIIASHVGTLVGPALVLTAFAPTGTGLLAFPRFIAGGGAFVIAILVLSVAQVVLGSLLGLRNLRQMTPVGVHVIGPTFIAWVGLAGATLGVAAAGETVSQVPLSDLLGTWTRSLAAADLPRQYGFLAAGWGWLAALATVTIGAFVRREVAPLKPGFRLAIIAAACTLPTVVLLIGGDLVAIRSGVYLIATAIAAGGTMALAAPTISAWSVSNDTLSRGRAFSIIWMCGCATVVVVATQGLAMAWQAQGAALVAAALDEGRAAVSAAARAHAELSTELTYLSAGLALAWLTLAMRGRRVVLSAPSQCIGSVLVTLLLATSIGVANNLYEHGATRQHDNVLAMVEPAIDEVELPTAPVLEPMRLSTVVRIEPKRISAGDTALATRADDGWLWRDDGALVTTPVHVTLPWQHALCDNVGGEVAVAAPRTMNAPDLISALTELRHHGVCRIELLARRATIPFAAGTLSPWVRRVVDSTARQPFGVSFYLSVEPTADEATGAPPLLLRWRDAITVESALERATPNAVLLLPSE